ncbi:MAG: hypothetical protein HYS08_03440 [Chlamydiae bacterium]|nr:hypothetical protein [Chlamydiota bacterium]
MDLAGGVLCTTTACGYFSFLSVFFFEEKGSQARVSGFYGFYFDAAFDVANFSDSEVVVSVFRDGVAEVAFWVGENSPFDSV